MKTNVTRLRQPDEDIIDMLKDLLARAKKGEFAALSWSGVSAIDGSLRSNWMVDGSNDRNGWMLIGATSNLLHKLNTAITD